MSESKTVFKVGDRVRLRHPVAVKTDPLLSEKFGKGAIFDVDEIRRDGDLRVLRVSDITGEYGGWLDETWWIPAHSSDYPMTLR